MAEPVRSHLVPGTAQERIQAVTEVEVLRLEVNYLRKRIDALEQVVSVHLAQTWAARWWQFMTWMRSMVNG